MIRSFPHFGIYVADIDRATRFYVEGLGFDAQEGGRTDAPGPLLEMPGANVRTQFVKHPDGLRMELWTVENRDPAGGPVDPRPANVPGRAHLCLVVDNLDTVAARIAEFGGYRLNESRSDLGYGELMFCADPDGTRIELVQVKSGWTGYAEE
ncbi:lactoylglutathione lyase [Sphingobium sp. OAS761]|uniref:VOC family protein n=1 Tax=Sphingobium sp. OAS761 TaxID=2817901 RepID=UPI00209CC3DB|nr:VOC family protein [Sphingobium sp. OAS761]MCP1470393.1 lactoylglutathione lyase [Sphingobium sp. OAS761]